MALLERVSTLLRANINDVLAKAEDPEKLARQLVLDMRNQLLQVKTQVAIALADQHLLTGRHAEQIELAGTWRRKAETAVARGLDDAARGALERALSHRRLAEGLAAQLADQAAEVDTLRSAYTRLEQRLHETEQRVELLAQQQRRHRVARKLDTARALIADSDAQAKLSGFASAVESTEARNTAERALLSLLARDSIEERFNAMEQKDQIEALLLELKAGARDGAA